MNTINSYNLRKAIFKWINIFEKKKKKRGKVGLEITIQYCPTLNISVCGFVLDFQKAYKGVNRWSFPK